jgi:phosphonate transport system substrate-binding protein
MHLEPPPRSTFFTVFLPTALSLFTIVALILIFSAGGDGSAPARRERPPTSEARVEGTGEAESTVEVTAEAATLEATIETTPIPTSDRTYTLQMPPPSELPWQVSMPEIGNGLSEASGLSIVAAATDSYAEGIESLCSGEIDIAILDIFAYLVARERGCTSSYEMLTSIRMGLPTYWVQIITSPDSGIETVEDLQGKVFCQPDAETFYLSGWRIPDLMLRANGIDPDTDITKNVIVTSARDDVLQAVVSGDCDAGAIFGHYSRLSEDELSAALESVVVIAILEPIPNDILVFEPNIPIETQRSITDALSDGVNYHQNDLDNLMGDFYGWEGVEYLGDEELEPLRQLFEAAGENVEDYVR